MNKNYKKAIINEMFDRNVLKSEEDRAEAKEMLEGMDIAGDLADNFEEDVELAIEAWESNEEEETAPKTVEEEVEEIVSSLKVGYNLIPGLGVACASDEKDLENLKNYLRGCLTAHFTLKRIFEDWA